MAEVCRKPALSLPNTQSLAFFPVASLRRVHTGRRSAAKRCAAGNRALAAAFLFTPDAHFSAVILKRFCSSVWEQFFCKYFYFVNACQKSVKNSLITWICCFQAPIGFRQKKGERVFRLSRVLEIFTGDRIPNLADLTEVISFHPNGANGWIA